MPRTTLKQQIETRLGDTFRNVIINHIPLGTGRYEAARILEDLCEEHREPGQESIKVLHSTLWYAIKRAIEETGELCEVEGDPNTNPLFYFGHGKSKHISRPKPEPKTLEIDCTWTCSECDTQWSEHKVVKSVDMMAVRSKCCPSCQKKGINTFGKIVLDFELNGTPATKAVVSIDGKPRETFVDSMLDPCPSPFEKETVTC